MSSNDLLSYSIMHSGDKVSSLSYNFLLSAQLPLPLPLPLKSVPLTNNISAKEPVVLPPINNYVHKLTENNLTHFATATVNYAKHSAASSTPPSLTSASSTGSLSPSSSPNMSSASLASSFNEYTSAPMQPKRRQRLGPSCDACRSRKVKCNAEIVVLSKSFNLNSDLSEFNLSLSQINDLVNLKLPITVASSYNLIISNNKLIKFKSCESCKSKSLPCCFSKGFTKEDILLNSKKPGSCANISISSVPCLKIEAKKLKSLSPVPSKNKVVKKKEPKAALENSRKSSCSSCRKRKVKCVFNPAINKCEGCVKKGHGCTFDITK